MEYDVFISHASEDKIEIARPLTLLLRQMGVKVWLDEFELCLGDSLRKSIDKGLSLSKFGVVILSHNFFSKDWPQRELNGLAAREDEDRKVILPIWHKITKEDVARFSPMLADKLAVSTDKGPEQVAHAVFRVIKGTTVSPETDPLPPGIPPARLKGNTSTAVPVPPAHPQNPESSPRWARFLLPSLVVAALSVILGLALGRYWWHPDKPEAETVEGANTQTSTPLQSEEASKGVFIVGGGTAYTYLTESGFFKALDEQKIPYHAMQGPTGTVAALFPHIFEDVTFLVMASKKLKITDLQSEGKPESVFEAYLGPDPFQMLFLAPKDAEESVLYDDFKEILTNPSIKQLDFAKLRNSGKWVDGGYAVYTGSLDAGTRAVWEERLQAKELAWWPGQLKFWDIRAPEEMLLAEDARIYLGSEVLFRGPTKSLGVSGRAHERLSMVDGPKGVAKRGLYLYGFLNTQKSVQHGDRFGYRLPKSVTLLLTHVYKSDLYLFNKNEEKDKQCLQRQIDYFHLESEQESEAGWVEIHTGKKGIFGAKPCDGQPEQ